MQEIIHLSDLWEHTITKIFKHDPESELGIMIREWVIYNKLEDFNSLLKFTNEELMPHGHGSPSLYKENGDSVVKMMSPTPLQELINLRWYIQHLIHESGYLYDDDESNYLLSEDKWMLQTHGKFMKYVFYTLHRMTPELMKKNPIKPIIKVKTNEELVPVETSQVLTVFNNAIHHEDDSSDDKSVIDIEPPQENGEQEIGKQDKLLTTTFQIEIENRKVKGLITYSTDQQIFKFKVNSWGVNIEFSLYELKWTIHAILQHMGFYHTTENPCVMMRAKHNTKSCECIIIHQDELYIASSTLQEILHIVKEK